MSPYVTVAALQAAMVDILVQQDLRVFSEDPSSRQEILMKTCLAHLSFGYSHEESLVECWEEHPLVVIRQQEIDDFDFNAEVSKCTLEVREALDGLVKIGLIEKIESNQYSLIR